MPGSQDFVSVFVPKVQVRINTIRKRSTSLQRLFKVELSGACGGPSIDGRDPQRTSSIPSERRMSSTRGEPEFQHPGRTSWGSALSEAAEFREKIGGMDRFGKNFKLMPLKFGGRQHVCRSCLS